MTKTIKIILLLLFVYMIATAYNGYANKQDFYDCTKDKSQGDCFLDVYGERF